MKDNRVYVRHILRCISRIEEYTAGGRESFFASPLVQDGVIRNLQTMAESTQRLSDRVRGSRPDIDWKALAGFRNVLVHDYSGYGSECSGDRAGHSPFVMMVGNSQSRTALRLIQEWAVLHQAELQINWEQMKAGRPLNGIAPLE